MLKQGNQSKVMFEDGDAATICSYSCAARTVAVNTTAAMVEQTTTATKGQRSVELMVRSIN
jgi:hypothetical protein